MAIIHYGVFFLLKNPVIFTKHRFILKIFAYFRHNEIITETVVFYYSGTQSEFLKREK